MRGKRHFLQWALYASLIIIGAFIGARLGWIEYLKEEPTHLTVLPCAVFIIAMLALGRACWRLDAGADPVDVWYTAKHGHYAASVCVSLGLIGTAIGYFVMLKHGHSGTDTERIIDGAFANTAIAVINTIFGAVCGLLTEVPSHFLMHAAKRAYESPEEDAAPAAPSTPVEPLPAAAEPVTLVAPKPEDAS